MSLLGKIFKPLALPFVALNKALIKPLFGLLTPKTPKLSTQTGSEQLTTLSAQNNAAKLGEPQAILYGLTTFYPPLCQQPWSRFVDNEQVLYMRLRVGVGIYSMPALRVGQVPFGSLPGARCELYLPGQPATLFHPNVYVAEQVNGIDIVGGALQTRTYTGEIVFSGNRLRVPDDPASVAARAAAGINPFDGSLTVSTVIVSGTPSNDGEYEITGIDSSDPQDYLDTDHTFVTETVVASIAYGRYDLDDTGAPTATAVSLVFDGARSTIKALPTGPNPNTLSAFLQGDLLSPISSGAGSNRYEQFSVLGIDYTDGSRVVAPPPDTLAGISDVVLLRRYYGSGPVCPAGDKISGGEIDLGWLQGIGSKGGSNPMSMRFDLQYQSIDDAGTPVGGWLSFPEISVTEASRKPLRRTFPFSLATPDRIQLRLAQTSKDASDTEVLDAVQWLGARGFVVPRDGERPEVDDDSTTLMIELRTNAGQVLPEDQKINGDFQRLLETWDADTETWLPESPTCAVVWAALDKLRGRYTMRGRQIPDDEIDLPGFMALHAIAEARGDQFNGQISVTANLLDNVNSILRLCRAEVDYRWQDDLISVYRDAPSAPVQLFCDLNSTLSDYDVRLRTDNDATGVQGSYQVPAFNSEGLIGIGNTDDKAIKIDLRNGCNSRDQMWREINYEWGSERLRNRQFSLGTELEALLMARGSRVLVQSRKRGWGQAAQVAHQTGRLLLVWPAPDWSGTGHRVILRSPEGVPGAPITCSRGATDRELLLDADPDVEITGDLFLEDRTLMILVRDGDEPVTAVVNSADWASSAGAGQNATVSLTIDDARVHAEPGPTPVDPFAPVISPPSLAVLNLDATDNLDGTVILSFDPTPPAQLYETDWRYRDALTWRTARRGVNTALSFTVPEAGEIEIRVRAFGGGAIGAYSYLPLTVSAGAGGPTPLTVTVTPASITRNATTTTAITGVCQGEVMGGEPPYVSSNWVHTGGSAAVLAMAPTAPGTAFRTLAINPGTTQVATYVRRVTDSLGTVADSPPVTVTITNTSGGGTPGRWGY